VGIASDYQTPITKESTNLWLINKANKNFLILNIYKENKLIIEKLFFLSFFF